MKIPTPEEVSAEFIAVLNEWLTPEQLEQVRVRNAVLATNPGQEDCCASHDFCDANVAMEEAFKRCGLDPSSTGVPDTDYPLMSDEVLEVWNKAWALAKAKGFTP